MLREKRYLPSIIKGTRYCHNREIVRNSMTTTTNEKENDRKPSIESQNSSQQEEEKMTIKGQRSKRKRPSPFKEKASFNESEGVSQSHQDSAMDGIMDANWILMKLGNDAIGKRVEVHQTSDNSWLVPSISFCSSLEEKLSIY